MCGKIYYFINIKIISACLYFLCKLCDKAFINIWDKLVSKGFKNKIRSMTHIIFKHNSPDFLLGISHSVVRAFVYSLHKMLLIVESLVWFWDVLCSWLYSFVSLSEGFTARAGRTCYIIVEYGHQHSMKRVYKHMVHTKRNA